MSIKEPIYNPDDKLEEALAQLADGISLEAILNEAGDDAEWLRPMLEITAQVSDLQQTIPIPPPDSSLQRLLSYAEELAAIPQPDIAPPPAQKTKISEFFNKRPIIRLVVGLAATVLLIALLGGGLNFVAQDSLPGQPLYRVKRAGEALQLSLAQNSEQRERLTQVFNQRRQTEINQLLGRGMQAEVEFTSSVEAVTATEITVNGLTTQITPDTEIVGILAVEAQVQVQGITQPPDAIKALIITVLEPAPDAAVPSPTLVNTATPSPTLIQTPSPQPQATSLPLITAPTETAATPPPSPTPVPTQLPIVDEDSTNDNDNSNENLPDELDDVDNDDTPLTTSTATSRPPADDGNDNAEDGFDNDDIGDDNANEDDIIDDIDDGDVDDFDGEFDDNDNSSGGNDNSGSGNSGSGGDGEEDNDNSGSGNGDDDDDTSGSGSDDDSGDDD